MKKIGLTGNAGCGKSTIAALLAKYPNITILNCDQIAKDILAQKTHRDIINSILGENVFFDNSAVHKRIAEIIFSDVKKKRSLEAFVHPLVGQAIKEEYETLPSNTLCIVESAIIYEVHWEKRFDAIVVATCNISVQSLRLRERGYDTNRIMKYWATQIPSTEKESRADFVIRTDCSFEELKTRVRTLYQQLKELPL